MSYVLKATTKKGETLYYMNVICVTEQIEYAEQYSTEEKAANDLQYFRNMFFYEEPKIEMIKV